MCGRLCLTKVSIVWGYSFVRPQSRRSHEPPHRRPQRDFNFRAARRRPRCDAPFRRPISSRRWRSPRCEHATREPPALSQHQRTVLEAVVARMSRRHSCVGERHVQ